jgi:DNA-binding NarL/FixJ family response regulator
MTIQVLVVDDHDLMREGLALALDNHPDITIVGEAANGQEALTQVELLHPDVLLLDVFMPVLDGIAVARRMRAEFPVVRVVVLTMDNDATDIQQLLDARVAGIVLKDARSGAVAEAIRAAMRGDPVPILPDAMGTHGANAPGPAPLRIGARFELTERERQILCCLARGASNKRIAATFGLSERTVRNHLYHIFKKMAVDDRTQAMILALRYDLCPETTRPEPVAREGMGLPSGSTAPLLDRVT